MAVGAQKMIDTVLQQGDDLSKKVGRKIIGNLATEITRGSRQPTSSSCFNPKAPSLGALASEPPKCADPMRSRYFLN